MKRTLNWTLTTLAAVVLLFQGCVSSTARKTADQNLNADTVYQSFMAKGNALSQQENYTQSLQAYELALAVSPSDSEAMQKKINVESILAERAEIYFKQGLKLDKQGRFKAAKERYLTALRLWPKHGAALEKLKEIYRPLQHPYAVHTIIQGENLSLISKKYYGGLKHFDVIAKFNGIEDVTQIRIGQKIKIPRVQDLPFPADVDLVQPDLRDIASAGKAVEVEQTEIYKDQGIALFEQKEYDEAAFEFLKVIRAKPDDATIKDYLFRCYLEQGNQMMDKQKYVNAQKKYELALTYEPDCTFCHDRISESSNRIKEYHYKQGITFFEQQQPEEAIVEWRKVEAIDPNFKQVKALIERAQIIVNKLEAIKQSTTQ